MSWACWGARPLAMGGAFTGLADDPNAIYWNPGAMGLNKDSGISITQNASGINSLNYDRQMTSGFHTEYGTIGLVFVSNETDNQERDSVEEYYQFGYGYGNDWLGVGVSFKDVQAVNVDDEGQKKKAGFADADFGIMLIPYESEDLILRVGVLGQNIFKGQLKDEGREIIFNVRPGFSIDSDYGLLSFEFYNALGEEKERFGRVGIEEAIGDHVLVRSGLYQIGEDIQAFTYGGGVHFPIGETKVGLDLTVMEWRNQAVTFLVGGSVTW